MLYIKYALCVYATESAETRSNIIKKYLFVFYTKHAKIRIYNTGRRRRDDRRARTTIAVSADGALRGTRRRSH